MKLVLRHVPKRASMSYYSGSCNGEQREQICLRRHGFRSKFPTAVHGLNKNRCGMLTMSMRLSVDSTSGSMPQMAKCVGSAFSYSSVARIHINESK